MKTIKSGRQRESLRTPELQNTVRSIIEDVRKRGDEAVLEYSEKFDHSKRRLFKVEEAEISGALSALSKTELSAMKTAISNIRAFAEAQNASLCEINSFEVMPGVILGHRLVPVGRVCCYIPGGNYPLFSSAMMLIIPARVAGVKSIAAASPVVKGTDKVHPKTLAAAALAGAGEFYAVGGAQAVAAFAYGTAQIKAADLIVGPGNAWVAEAKRQCYGQAGIDFIAGPSEVLIIADKSAKPGFIACDLLAQCEHDPLAQAILVSTDEKLALDAAREIEKELKTLPTGETAGKSWADYGEIYLADNLDEAADFANSRAPEHLELQTAENDALAAKLHNYGALFIGENSAEVFGDYAAGTNHTLPTLRAARWTGGLWPGAFLKTLTFQKSTKEGAANLAPVASALAELEGLAAHSLAARKRQTA